MDYSQYVTRLGELLVVPVSNAASATPFQDTDANAILPAIIDYAEQRCYREFDLLETFESVTATLTANSRKVTLPSSVVVLQSTNVITPVSALPDDSGAQRHSLRRVSVDFLNYVCPISTQTAGTPSVPIYVSDLDNTHIQVGPAPDANYTIEFIGTFRPATLSSVNTSTILTTYIPDIFVIASMVFASGYQKNFGNAGPDLPMQAVTWEGQYQALKSGAMVEIQRKKSQGPAWTGNSPAPIATASRSQ